MSGVAADRPRRRTARSSGFRAGCGAATNRSAMSWGAERSSANTPPVSKTAATSANATAAKRTMLLLNERGQHAADDRGQPRLDALSRRQHFDMRDLVHRAGPDRHIGYGRDAQHAHARVAGHDDLRDRGHPDGVGAAALQEADFGHGLERGPANHGVNTFLELEAALGCRRVRGFA